MWSLVLSGCLFVLAVARPSVLRFANRVWMKVGLLLGKVLNPVVTALLFFLVFTPAAVILRWMAKDLLSLKLNPQAKTYWIERSESGPVSSMADQF